MITARKFWRFLLIGLISFRVFFPWFNFFWRILRNIPGCIKYFWEYINIWKNYEMICHYKIFWTKTVNFINHHLFFYIGSKYYVIKKAPATVPLKVQTRVSFQLAVPRSARKEVYSMFVDCWPSFWYEAFRSLWFTVYLNFCTYVLRSVQCVASGQEEFQRFIAVFIQSPNI